MQYLENICGLFIKNIRYSAVVAAVYVAAVESRLHFISVEQ